MSPVYSKAESKSKLHKRPTWSAPFVVKRFQPLDGRMRYARGLQPVTLLLTDKMLLTIKTKMSTSIERAEIDTVYQWFLGVMLDSQLSCEQNNELRTKKAYCTCETTFNRKGGLQSEMVL